jgi:hypothetical protein
MGVAIMGILLESDAIAFIVLILGLAAIEILVLTN